jgi:hypothetical protein
MKDLEFTAGPLHASKKWEMWGEQTYIQKLQMDVQKLFLHRQKLLVNVLICLIWVGSKVCLDLFLWLYVGVAERPFPYLTALAQQFIIPVERALYLLQLEIKLR